MSNLVRNFADDLVYYTGTYREGPEQIFERVELRYGDLQHKKPYGAQPYVELVLIDEATGSDYSGGTHTRSNYDALLELASEEDLLGSELWEVHGGHGTYGIAVLADSMNEALITAIRSLADYPILNENDWSEKEMEAQDEAWESWARSDFATALEKHFDLEDDDLFDVDSAVLYEVFRQGQEAANEYWTEEEGANMWVDVNKVAAAVDEDFLNEKLAEFRALNGVA